MKHKIIEFKDIVDGATIAEQFNAWTDASEHRVQSILAVGDALLVLYVERPGRPPKPA